MIRVVIDTNVLVSALLHANSLPEAVIKLAVSRNVQWLASEPILVEYAEVLRRPRFAIDSDKLADAMMRIQASVAVVVPIIRIEATIDPDDNIFLECAQAGSADYIVTGNIRHFPRTWQKTQILTPREFIDAWTAAP
jgi:uncharacterized protein